MIVSNHQHGKASGTAPSDFTRGYAGGVADARTGWQLHTAAGGGQSAPISGDDDISSETWNNLVLPIAGEVRPYRRGRSSASRRELALRREPVPSRMVLMSFVTDATLSNPDIAYTRDPIIDPRNADFYPTVNHWRDGLELTDPMLTHCASNPKSCSSFPRSLCGRAPDRHPSHRCACRRCPTPHMKCRCTTRAASLAEGFDHQV